MLDCFVFCRFGDLLIVWLFDCLVVCLVGSLVGWFALFCPVLFGFNLLLLYSSIGGLEKSMYRKVLLSEAPFRFNSRKRVRHKHSLRPNAVV